MYHKSRKCRSEAQLRHDTLLHKSRDDHVAYQVASLEDMSNTVKQYRERARVAEADAEHSKKALFETQNQVSPLRTVCFLRRDTHRFKMRGDQAKETRSRAIEKAVDRVRKHYKSAETKRVKRPDGRIEDWVRNPVVELVVLDGVPTAKVLQVIDIVDTHRLVHSVYVVRRTFLVLFLYHVFLCSC